MNPGPAMIKAFVANFATPPSDVKHSNGAGHPAPAKAATMTIKGVAKAPAVKPPQKPATAKDAAVLAPASKAQPKPPVPSSPAAKKGLLQQIAGRVYG